MTDKKSEARRAEPGNDTRPQALGPAKRVDETSRAILALLAEGRTLDEIFAEHPNLTTFDVMAAAAEGLSALEAPREARIRAARERHPRAFEPWTEEEDARLLLRWGEGAKLAELGRALQRPPGAIRMRLERHLGGKWRERVADPEGTL